MFVAYNQMKEVLQFENFDLESIKTSVNIDVFHKLLIESNYDKNETEFLIYVFTNGLVLDMRVHKM